MHYYIIEDIKDNFPLNCPLQIVRQQMQHWLKRLHSLTLGRWGDPCLNYQAPMRLSCPLQLAHFPRDSSTDRIVCQQENTYKVFANHSIDPVTHPIWNSLAWWAALNESCPALPQWWEVLGKATETCLLSKEELLLSIQAQYCTQSPKQMNK